MTKKKFLESWANPSRPYNNSHVPKQTTSAVTRYWLNFLFSTLDSRPQVWRGVSEYTGGSQILTLFNQTTFSHLPTCSSTICRAFNMLYVGSVTSVFSRAISSTISYPESSGVCSAGKHPERLVYGLHFPRKRGFPVSSPVLEIRMKVSDCLIIAGWKC